MLAISVTVPEKSAARADCHFVTEPVCPDKLSEVELVPAHTAVPPLMVPPTVCWLTVIVETELLLAAHEPLVTTALK